MELSKNDSNMASLPTLGSHIRASEHAEWLGERVGTTVGSLHRVVRHLASGGMGHVFLVEHLHLGCYAAAKMPEPRSSAARRVLANEAELLSRLQHPNIVSVLDYGRADDGLEYMLMEYVSGLELDAWLESCGTMKPARALNILKQLASAVDYLHAHDIVHCDIKPANIMFDPRAHDFVKLIDFGIACEKSMGAERRGLIGTPAYMAPEQARGEMCGPAVDVYGVAALALEILTGLPPYDYATPQAAITAILCEPPATPSSRGIDVPGLDAVFAKALHSDPEARFASATEFVEALEEVFNAASADKSDTGTGALGQRSPRTQTKGFGALAFVQRWALSHSWARAVACGVFACTATMLASLVSFP
jgi:serine/threonine protein kinase